jgi:hypothetical protein
MEKNMKTQYKLSDNVIAHIAQLVQLAMITGSDIVDHMRMMRLTETEDKSDFPKLDLDSDYMVEHETRIKTLVAEAEAMAQEAQKKNTGFVQ